MSTRTVASHQSAFQEDISMKDAGLELDAMSGKTELAHDDNKPMSRILPSLDPTSSEQQHAELVRKFPKPQEHDQDDRDRNVEERAGFFSRFTFSYATPLVSLAYNRTITESDLPKLSTNHSATLTAPLVTGSWEEEMKRHADAVKVKRSQLKPGEKLPPSEPSLSKAILRTLGWPLVFILMAQVVIRVEQTFEPILIEKILLWLAPAFPGFAQEKEVNGYLYGLALVLMIFVQNMLSEHYWKFGVQLHMQTRSALCAMIYTKALKVVITDDDSAAAKKDAAGDDATTSSSDAQSKDPEPTADRTPSKPENDKTPDADTSAEKSKSTLSMGQVVNLMSVDTEKIGDACYFASAVPFVPIQMAITLWLLHDTIGNSMFAGLGTLFVVLPFVVVSLGKYAVYMGQRMTIADRRVKLTNEILQGIRIVKFYAWEYFFNKEVNSVRNEELDTIFNMNLMGGVMYFAFMIMMSVFIVVVFTVYSSVGNSFNPAVVFKAMAYINALQAPLFQLPGSLATLGMASVSAQRIKEFLMLPELETAKDVDTTRPLFERKRAYLLKKRLAQREGSKVLVDALASVKLAYPSKGYDRDLDAEALAALDQDPTEIHRSTAFDIPNDVTNAVELHQCTFTWTPVQKSIANIEEIDDVSQSQPATTGDQVVIELGVENAHNSNQSDNVTQQPLLGDIPAALGQLTLAQRRQLDRLPIVLKNIDFKAMQGKITAIVGPVGSGKSSLLAGILGEVDRVRGRIARDPTARLAYVAQTAWIQTMSIIDNITFGEPPKTKADRERYEHTLDVCALRQDLTQFEAGDLTEIGDRGINLSGGQKQRVAIARAVYANADIYLFDDPLSAVDAHVAEHIFTHCIEGRLAGKTRILVMNQLHLLPRCDYIYVLDTSHSTPLARTEATTRVVVVGEDDQKTHASHPPKDALFGYVAEHGTYSQLSTASPHFNQLMKSYRESLEKKASETAESKTASVETPILHASDLKPQASTSHASPISSSAEDEKNQKTSASEVRFHLPANVGGDVSAAEMLATTSQHVSNVADQTHDTDHANAGAVTTAQAGYTKAGSAYVGGGKLQKGKQIQDEELIVGKVPWRIYWWYAKNMGWSNFALFIGFTILSQAANAWLGLLLGYWADDKWNKSSDWYRVHYILTLVVTAAAMLIRSYYYARGATKASAFYHSRMLDRVLRASSSFFDVTPAGRILNRFSKDLDSIDMMVPHSILNITGIAAMLVSSLVVCAIVQPWFTIVVVVILMGFAGLQSYYCPAAVQCQRIESNLRSPLYQHFSETLRGITTIRAFGRTAQFQMENFKRIDNNNRALYWLRITHRWGSLRVACMQVSMIIAAVYLVVGTRGDLAVGVSGVVLTYMFSFSAMLSFIVMMIIELAARMNSVERLSYYIDGIPQEASLDEGVNGFRPPADWPSQGIIQYDHVKMRYRPELPPVLHSLSFDVKAGERIGVVGRTGSGKSSLMMLLMRLYEIQRGVISIDGIDISKLALHDLRKKIGIVPQDPVLFSGTLRSNLDPFKQYTDAEIFNALAAVSLDRYVESLPEKLENRVVEFGTNLSQGQRQLVCLARVLLKKPKVLLLDEATSSVDGETDSLLRKTIAERFPETTMLIIAHRLNTVMNSNRILVLEKGDMLEYDSPANLIAQGGEATSDDVSIPRKRGHFADLYRTYVERSRVE